MLPAQVAAGATTPLAGHLLLPPARNTQQDPRKTSEGSFSICLPPEALRLLPLQKSLPTPRLEQKVPAHVEAWKTLRGLGSVGNKPLPPIPSAEFGAGGTRVWEGQHPWRGAGGTKGTKGPFATSEGHSQRKTRPAWSQIPHGTGARCCPGHSSPRFIPGASQTIARSWGSPKNPSEPCPGFSFQMSPCHNTSVTSWGWGQGQEAPALPLPPLAGNSSPRAGSCRAKKKERRRRRTRRRRRLRRMGGL